jgi:hypothetical protein
MNETLYKTTYLKHYLLSDAERKTLELTQTKLSELLQDGTISLIEVTQVMENGNLKKWRSEK